MVTTAPSIANHVEQAGIATISFDFSLTFVCASTRRCRAARLRPYGSASSISPWLPDLANSLAVDGDDVHRRFRQPRNPIDEAALKSLGVERGENVAQSVAAAKPSAKGRNRRNRFSFASPNCEIAVKLSAPASTPSSATSKNLIQGIDDFPRLPSAAQIAEMTKKTRSPQQLQNPPNPSRTSRNHREYTTDSAIQPFVTKSFTINLAWHAVLQLLRQDLFCKESRLALRAAGLCSWRPCPSSGRARPETILFRFAVLTASARTLAKPVTKFDIMFVVNRDAGGYRFPARPRAGLPSSLMTTSNVETIPCSA